MPLERVGAVRQARGDLTDAAAAAAFEEFLSLSRPLRQSLGDSTQTLRDLSMSLNNLGDVQQVQDDLAGATAALDESLLLSRQIREQFGDTPQSRQDLLFLLRKVSKVHQMLGQAVQAEADALEQQLD